MKILLVIFHTDPTRGGAERYTIDLAHALKNRGHDVVLAATTIAEAASDFSPVLLPAKGLTRTQKYIAFLDALDSHLTSNQYDIVHAMLPVRQCDVYHPHAGIAANLPKNLTTLMNPRRGTFARIERELLTSPNAPVVLSLSSYIDRQIHAAYPEAEIRVERLMNAVDLEKFDSQKTEAAAVDMDGKVALIIAQDFARKGVGVAIDAIKSIDDVSLVVVGGDDPRPYLRLAKSISDRVQFVGSTTDPRPYYKQADFFVLPTRHDPCSLVVLEALAMGLPVVTTKQNGAADVMTYGVHGFILDRSDDVTGLREAMMKLMQANVAEAMRQACMELRPSLSYAFHLDRLLSIYESVGTKRP